MSDDVIAAHPRRAHAVATVEGACDRTARAGSFASLRRGVIGRFTTADRRAIGVLIILPLVLNLPFALAGHPLIASDNLTQNYPLRVLAGQMLAHGRLPLWDSQIWSGTPLLAGWNAGALYPGTWLFAVLPGVAAFEVNIVSAGVVSGVGFHLFLRRQGGSPLGSFLGALTFTYTGFMSAQSVHLGLVEGMAFAPVVLIAIDGIARTGGVREGGHFVALLGVSCGLVVLAGDPRALSNIAVLAAIFTVALCWRAPRRTPHLVASLILGGLLAAAISAVQWLPGLAYLHGTQRAARTFSYYSAGSLGWHDFAFLFVPFLVGGNGTLNMPTYPGPFSLIELTVGAGVLPLVALVALALRVVRPRSGQRLGVWFVTVVVSIILSAGGNLPTGHLLVHVPLFGGERLQNRNAGIGDFALCVLLALFVDAVGERVERPDGRMLLRRLLAAVPGLIVIGLVCTALADPGGVENFVAAVPTHPSIPGRMLPYFVVVVAIAGAAVALMLRDKWRPGRRRRLGAIIVVADVVVFIAMASYQPAPPPVLAAANSASSRVGAQLGTGREAILNPAQYALSANQHLLDEIGLDDLVVLRGQLSAEGYGSAVAAPYDRATGSHDVENLGLGGFLGSLYDELDLRVVAVVPELLGRPIPPGRRLPMPPGPPEPSASRSFVASPAGLAEPGPTPMAGPWRLGRRAMGFVLPGPVAPSSVLLAFDRAYGPLPRLATISLTLADGRIVRASGRPVGNLVTIPLPRTAQPQGGGGAVSLTVEASAPGEAAGDGPVLGAVATSLDSTAGTSVSTSPARRHLTFVLDGPLQGVVSPATWHNGGRVGPLVLLDNTAARGPAWLEAATASSPGAPRAPGSVTTLPVRSWQNPVELVSSKTASLLVRSEVFANGWSVELQRQGGGGKARYLPVRGVGLLQGVVLPAGDWVVTWRYRSVRAEAGLAAGAAGTLGALVLSIAGSRRRRRSEAIPTGDRSLPATGTG